MAGDIVGKPRVESSILIPSLLAVALLLGALLDEDSLGDWAFKLLGGSVYNYDLDWPNGYYIFLRFVVCIASVLVGVHGYRWGRQWVPWVFGLQAILYNPIIRVDMSVEAWVFWNFVSIALLLVGIFTVKPQVDSEEGQPDDDKDQQP